MAEDEYEETAATNEKFSQMVAIGQECQILSNN